MGFSLNEFLNDIVNSNRVNAVFNNPIYTAILIVVIVLIIIFFMFRSVVENSFWTLLFKTGFYILFPIMAVVFIHYKNLDREYESKYENKALTKAVEPTLGVKTFTGEGEKDILKLDKGKNASKIYEVFDDEKKTRPKNITEAEIEKIIDDNADLIKK